MLIRFWNYFLNTGTISSGFFAVPNLLSFSSVSRLLFEKHPLRLFFGSQDSLMWQTVDMDGQKKGFLILLNVLSQEDEGMFIFEILDIFDFTGKNWEKTFWVWNLAYKYLQKFLWTKIQPEFYIERTQIKFNGSSVIKFLLGLKDFPSISFQKEIRLEFYQKLNHIKFQENSLYNFRWFQKKASGIIYEMNPVPIYRKSFVNILWISKKKINREKEWKRDLILFKIERLWFQMEGEAERGKERIENEKP